MSNAEVIGREKQLFEAQEKGRLTRDLECASNVAIMAQLGCFDTEFWVFGCTYKENGKIYYRVSSKEEDIRQFIDECVQNDIYLHYSQGSGHKL